MGDLLWAASSRIIKKPIKIGEKADKVLKLLKYVILVLIFVFLWTLAVPLDSMYNPWNIFGMYSTFKGWTDLSAWISVGGILLLLIMAGDFLIERFFCRYLCPLGAIFALLSRFRLHKIKKPSEKCGNCSLCTMKCSMGIQLKKTDVVKSGECIDCYRCVDVCPRKNVTGTPAPAVAGTVAAVGIAGLYYAGTLAAPKLSSNRVDNIVAEESTDISAAYKDGVYKGTGKGFRGNISAEVTVKNGLIDDITIVSADDDKEFLNRASSGVIPRIISAQSVDVDTVSGATFSSKGIIEAVANALEIEKDDNSSNNSDTYSEKESNNESKNESGFGGEETSENSSSAEEENSASSDLSQIADGEYSGTGTGFRGETKVTVKVENHSITSVTIESYADDQQFFERAKDAVIGEIIAEQSVNVSTVSGATFSSRGIIEAVANALNISYSNPNDSDAQTPPGGGEKGHGGRGHGKGNRN